MYAQKDRVVMGSTSHTYIPTNCSVHRQTHDTTKWDNNKMETKP